jgi:hypothetical protein
MIISKEEAVDQAQVFVEEIIEENPDDTLESNLRDNCENAASCDDPCFTCQGGCKLNCNLFKRGRCEASGYCSWTLTNDCVCGAQPIGPVCGDENCDGGESCSNCPQDCYNQQDGCPQDMICSSRSGSEPYSCLGEEGSSCTDTVDSSDCASGTCVWSIDNKYCRPDHCNDNHMNSEYGETGIDCGGECGGCDTTVKIPPDSCAVNSDCRSGFCDEKFCNT